MSPLFKFFCIFYLEEKTQKTHNAAVTTVFVVAGVSQA